MKPKVRALIFSLKLLNQIKLAFVNPGKTLDGYVLNNTDVVSLPSNCCEKLSQKKNNSFSSSQTYVCLFRKANL